MVLAASPTKLVANGAAIRALRQAVGLKVTTLAEAVGISRAYLSNIEGERRQASPPVLRAIADALRVPITAISKTGAAQTPAT